MKITNYKLSTQHFALAPTFRLKTVKDANNDSVKDLLSGPIKGSKTINICVLECEHDMILISFYSTNPTKVIKFNCSCPVLACTVAYYMQEMNLHAKSHQLQQTSQETDRFFDFLLSSSLLSPKVKTDACEICKRTRACNIPKSII